MTVKSSLLSQAKHKLAAIRGVTTAPPAYEINEINELSHGSPLASELMALGTPASVSMPALDWEEQPAVIEPGAWHTGEPPAPPPADDAGWGACTWQDFTETASAAVWPQ